MIPKENVSNVRKMRESKMRESKMRESKMRESKMREMVLIKRKV